MRRDYLSRLRVACLSDDRRYGVRNDRRRRRLSERLSTPAIRRGRRVCVVLVRVHVARAMVSLDPDERGKRQLLLLSNALRNTSFSRFRRRLCS